MLSNNTLLLLFVLTGSIVSGQLKYYAEPVKIPISLSGNFGELRPDHFHMGLDFRTERRTGVPIYASAAGHVSRVAVSPSGYGRALYIDHPNGTTTVYAHLLRFREDIEEYVKAEQYLRQSFAVDLQVIPGTFSVEREEQIALSGNSGSSGGPHLHYEIRDTPSQDALNPLQINNFNVTDKTSPRISAVQFYPLDNQSHVDFRNYKKRVVSRGFGESVHAEAGDRPPGFRTDRNRGQSQRLISTTTKVPAAFFLPGFCSTERRFSVIPSTGSPTARTGI